MKKFLLVIIWISAHGLFAQNKPSVLLEPRNAGYFSRYYDLGNNGFVAAFDKSNNEVVNSKEISKTLYYFSADLRRKAVFKSNFGDNTQFIACNRYLLQHERIQNKYALHLFDYAGKEIASKNINLEESGLNAEMINRIFILDNGKVWFELYDLQQYLHFFELNMLDNSKQLLEMDIPLPGTDYLKNSLFKTEWKYLNNYRGFHFFYRSGSDRNFDPKSIQIQIAMYDEDMNLYRDFIISNVLDNNEILFGKNYSIEINPNQQSFYLSALTKRNNGKAKITVWKYGMNGLESNLKKLWQQDFDVQQNVYKLVDDDGITVPRAPEIKNNGNVEEIYLNKDRLVVNDEVLSQSIFIAEDGKVLYNSIQAGNFYSLNLDGFCGDNGNLYSRFNTTQMKQTLKDLCENKKAEVIDISIDDTGNELLIINKSDKTNPRFEIYRFTK